MYKVDLADWVGSILIERGGSFFVGFKYDGSDRVSWDKQRDADTRHMPRYLFSDLPFAITGKRVVLETRTEWALEPSTSEANECK
jgi:hypothetical protein